MYEDGWEGERKLGLGDQHGELLYVFGEGSCSLSLLSTYLPHSWGERKGRNWLELLTLAPSSKWEMVALTEW